MSVEAGNSRVREHRRLEFRDMLGNNFTALKPTAFPTLIPSLVPKLFVPQRSYVFLNISVRL